MPDDIIINQSEPDSAIVDSPSPEVIDELIDETDEDINELQEALAVHSIMSEQRHEEILEGIEECQTRLETLSATAQTAESPILTQVLNQLVELRAEIATIRASMDSLSERPIPTESHQLIPENENAADQPAVVIESAEPEAQPEATPKKQRRIFR